MPACEPLIGGARRNYSRISASGKRPSAAPSRTRVFRGGVEPPADLGMVLGQLLGQAVLVDAAQVVDAPFELVERQLGGPVVAGSFLVVRHDPLPLTAGPIVVGNSDDAGGA